MNDGRLSRTPPHRTRCAACDGATAQAPGAVCSACGRESAPPDQLPVPDLRRAPQDRLGAYCDSVAFGVGLIYLLLLLLFAFIAPAMLIPSALLIIPVVIRTVRVASLPVAHDAKSIAVYLIVAFVASFGVVALAGTAAAVAFCGAFLTIPGGNSISSPTSVYVWSGTAASVVFLSIFLVMWPRERSGESIHRSPDPEN